MFVSILRKQARSVRVSVVNYIRSWILGQQERGRLFEEAVGRETSQCRHQLTMKTIQHICLLIIRASMYMRTWEISVQKTLR